MQKYFRIAISSLLLVTATACGLFLNEPLGEVGQLATIRGVVQSVDTSPMAFDGPAELIIASQDHGRVRVLIQSCLGGCALEAVDQLATMVAGETWSVRGEVRDRNSLLLYQDGEHDLQPITP